MEFKIRYKIKNLVTSLFIFSIFIFTLNASATFSIIAVDTNTREFGSTLATCIYDETDLKRDFTEIIKSSIDSRIIAYTPSLGIMNMLGVVDNLNPLMKRLANRKMSEEWSANTIIDEFTTNIDDMQADNSIRKKQLLAITMDSRSLQVYKNFYNGPELGNYSNALLGTTDDSRYHFVIAGNILTSQDVLTSLEYGFKRTPGNLKRKLEGALKNVRRSGNIGDARCIKEKNISANVSFIKIYKHDKIETDLLSYTILSDGEDAIDKITRKNFKRKFNLDY